jgi:uncharacterized protein (TIGR02118 family)
MIKVSVLYPKTETSKFDMKYYLERHIPMVKARLGAAIKNAAVEEGLAGGAPGEGPAYAAMGHLYFESVDAFQASFAPHAETILADIPNYSNVSPKIVVSQVLV